MRILFVTGRYHQGDPKRGTAYELQNFLPALQRLGHDVEVFDNTGRAEFADFAAMNRELLTRVDTWKPDAILYAQHRYEIWNETWDIIRKARLATLIYFAADDSWKYKQASRLIARHFDVCATTYGYRVADYHRDGNAAVVKTQWAADSTRLQPPIAAEQCEYDVTFIGQSYGRRPHFVKLLGDSGIKIEAFGYGWPNGPIASEKITPTLRSSKITLNFSGSGLFAEQYRPQQKQIKARVFEVPGSGGFLLTEWAPGIEQEYDLSREIDVFKNDRELVDKVRFYLAHPEERDRRAERAYERTVAEHTYDREMKKILDCAAGQRALASAGTGDIDWTTFEKVAAKHTLTPGLRKLRTSLIALFSLPWGKRRGARAARKALFEWSWRFAGEKTYSAAGLPGRLFYAES